MSYFPHVASLLYDGTKYATEDDAWEADAAWEVVTDVQKTEVEALLKQFYQQYPQYTVPRVASYSNDESMPDAFWIIWDGPYDASPTYPGFGSRGLAFIEEAVVYISQHATTGVQVSNAINEDFFC